MKTIIHVNQHVIKANRKSGRRDPVLTVKTYKDNQYASEVAIQGPCRVIYRPDKPLACGATVWIETESEVIPLQADSPVVESVHEQRNRPKVAKKVGARRAVRCELEG